MEWSIRSLSKRCGVSGEAFSDGDSVMCFVFKTESGEIERTDVLERNVPALKAPGTLVGFWRRVFSSDPAASADMKQKLVSQEDFFFSLFDVPPSEDGEILKQFVALYLERKRILRAAGAPENGFQNFIHVKSKKKFSVPVRDADPETLARLASVIDAFII